MRITGSPPLSREFTRPARVEAPAKTSELGDKPPHKPPEERAHVTAAMLLAMELPGRMQASEALERYRLAQEQEISEPAPSPSSSR